MRKILTFLLTSASLCLFAQNEIKDPSTGEVFPTEVTIEHDGKEYKLEATGVTTRKKLVVTVYSLASYLQDGLVGSGDKFDEILNADKAKQLTMKWARNVPADKIREGYMESFQKIFSSEDYSKYQNEINQFVNFFNKDVQKGDTYDLRWFPGGYLELDVNGSKVGSLSNAGFAKALWSFWFGPKSVVNRNQLVTLVKTNV